MMLLGIILSCIFGFFNAYLSKKFYNRNKGLSFWLGISFIGILWIICFIAAFNLLPYYLIFGFSEGNDFLWNWPFNIPFFGGGSVNYDYTALIGYEIIIILSYPLWYGWSGARFRQIFGGKPWQKGLLYIFTVPKRPKGVKKGEKAIKPPLCEFKECDDDLSRNIDE
ncbi:MAG: hypothetical protein GF329_12060 [Candidatus Lokiarchaeota archaeon]|nr:hypothetical protein [Candidatus Lokiarchaeota archaeon]